MKIIFLGAPGAGKGTQAAAVSRELKIPTISTGNMIREAIAQGTPVGIMAKDIIGKGQLLSDEIVVGIVKEKLKTIEGGYMQQNPGCRLQSTSDSRCRTRGSCRRLQRESGRKHCRPWQGS